MFTITVRPRPDCLLVEATGTASLAELCSYMDFVAALAGKQNQRRAVLNLLDLDVQFSFTDHLNLGAHAAAKLAQLDRVASVVNPRYRTGTSEKAAQKMGLKLRTFTSLDEGLDWVLRP